MNCEAYVAGFPGKTCESFEAGFTIVEQGHAYEEGFA